MSQRVIVRSDGTLAVEGSLPSVRATGTPGGTSPMYGYGGLFGICDADPTVINAMVGPVGIESIFTWRGSDVQHPLFESLVYIGSSGGTQASKCADCGTPSFKQCTQTYTWGRRCQMTNEHALDDIGLRANTQVPRVSLFGNITDAMGNVLLAQGQQITDMFTLELAGVAYNLRNWINWNLWHGNPANNAGGVMQPVGIPLIVNTNKVDSRNGMACESLDSAVLPGNFIIGAAGAPNLHDRLASMLRAVRYRISGMGKNPEGAGHVFIVSQWHWDCIARQLACEYGLICNNATDRNDALALREIYDRIKDTKQIPVDGEWWPVHVDNTMPKTDVSVGNDAGVRADIYLLTLGLEGETLFWGEYQDFNTTVGKVMAWFRSMFGSVPVSITDGGRFAWAPTTSGGFCFDARVLNKHRLVCLMPQLQARLTNVTCVPSYMYPDYTGSGKTYELTEGVSEKPYLSLYGYGSLPMGQAGSGEGGFA